MDKCVKCGKFIGRGDWYYVRWGSSTDSCPPEPTYYCAKHLSDEIKIIYSDKRNAYVPLTQIIQEAK